VGTREWLQVISTLMVAVIATVGGSWGMVTYLLKRDRMRIDNSLEDLRRELEVLRNQQARVREDMARQDERIKNRPDHPAIQASLERMEKKLGDQMAAMESRITARIAQIMKEKA
jgi:predicted  nucleic acid-binding Zn-ribbon protein